MRARTAESCRPPAAPARPGPAAGEGEGRADERGWAAERHDPEPGRARDALALSPYRAYLFTFRSDSSIVGDGAYVDDFNLLCRGSSYPTRSRTTPRRRRRLHGDRRHLDGGAARGRRGGARARGRPGRTAVAGRRGADGTARSPSPAWPVRPSRAGSPTPWARWMPRSRLPNTAPPPPPPPPGPTPPNRPRFGKVSVNQQGRRDRCRARRRRDHRRPDAHGEHHAVAGPTAARVRQVGRKRFRIGAPQGDRQGRS